MALSRVKTWVSGEILYAADLNAEFNNVLNNPVSLISPLTSSLAAGSNDITGLDELALENAGTGASAAGRLRRNATLLTWHDGTAARTVLVTPLPSAVDANGNDITALDELALNDATADASAAGRLRRNATRLTWHDGTAARGVLVSPLPASVDGNGNDITALDELALNDATADASAAGRLRRNGANLTWHNGTAARNIVTSGTTAGVTLGLELLAVQLTEQTTTNTADTNLVTLTPTGGIPDDAWLLVLASVRKSTGAAANGAVRVKIGTTEIMNNLVIGTDPGSPTNAAESGGIIVLISPRLALYNSGVFAATSIIDGTSASNTDLTPSVLSPVFQSNAVGTARSTGQTELHLTTSSGSSSITIGIDSAVLYAFKYS